MKRHMGKLISFLIGLLIFVFGLWFQDVSQIHDIREWMKVLSNAALFSGVLLTGIGLLVLISEEGIFDGIRYTISSLWASLRNEKKRYATYYDYIKREKKRSKASSMLIPGVCYLLFAVIFTIVFYI